MSETVNINPDKLYTKSEYSREFGVSRPTIDKMIKSKELTTIKINGTTLIIRD